MNKYEKEAMLMAPHVPNKMTVNGTEFELDNEQSQGKLILAYEMLGYCKLPVSKLIGASGSQKAMKLERNTPKIW